MVTEKSGAGEAERVIGTTATDTNAEAHDEQVTAPARVAARQEQLAEGDAAHHHHHVDRQKPPRVSLVAASLSQLSAMM